MASRAGSLIALAVPLATVLAACGNARTLEPNLSSCPTWKDEIAQTFASKCAGCHSGASPAAGVDLSTYAAVLASPGREALTHVLDPATATAPHKSLTSLNAQVSRWAGECKVSYLSSSIHGGGILDPTSADFHGDVVARSGYKLEECASCHGADYAGGKAGVACTTCHTQQGGPEACTTCHGVPPSSGAHIAHLTGEDEFDPVACSECHTVPKTYSDPGHIRTDGGGADLPPAEVIFGPLASTASASRKGPPAFDHASDTCSNVFCHGDALATPGASRPRPTWHGGPSQDECGSCHAAPPQGNHPADPDCVRCHSESKHVDGIVELGDAALGCNGCHGSPKRPLSGAHKSHLEGTHRLSSKVACTECHVVPATVGAAGHLDAAPADITFGALAKARGANPAYGNGSCSGTACHGTATVAWNKGPDAITCGSCHGIPPASAPHKPEMRLTDCASCHASTVDGHGNIRFNGDESTHINGRTDLVAQ